MTLRRGEDLSEERGEGVFAYETEEYLDAHPTAEVFVQLKQKPLTAEDLGPNMRVAAERDAAGIIGVLEEAKARHPGIIIGVVHVNRSFDLTEPSNVIKALAERDDVVAIGLQSLTKRPDPRRRSQREL